MALIKKYWFLIVLTILLVSGYLSSSHLAWLAEWKTLKWGVVFVTMFLMAWPVSFGQVKTAVGKPLPALVACAVCIVALPLIAWPVAFLTGPELGAGILVAAATPSTLASGAVLTRRARGNDSVAVMVSILTNATCFVVLPFWIYVQTGDQMGSGIFGQTIFKLLVFVVLPMTLGQLARLHTRSAEWATERKDGLSLVALCGVLSIVFLGAIKLGVRLEADGSSESVLSPMSLGLTIAIVASLHLIGFWIGLRVSKVMGFDRDDTVAVAFSGSQKTLMIGLSTAIELGFSFIPIVLFHAVQLMIDAVLAERYRDREEV